MLLMPPSLMENHKEAMISFEGASVSGGPGGPRMWNVCRHMRMIPKENDKEERDADDQLDHRDNQKFADHMKVGQSDGCRDSCCCN